MTSATLWNFHSLASCTDRSRKIHIDTLKSIQRYDNGINQNNNESLLQRFATAVSPSLARQTIDSPRRKLVERDVNV